MKCYSSISFRLAVALIVYLIGFNFQYIYAANIDENSSKLPQQVLVLNSQNAGFPWATILNQSIMNSFSKDILSSKVQLHVEYSGLSQNQDKNYQKLLIDLYHHKYRDVSPALILATDVGILEFIETHYQRLFPDVPVVYIANSQYVINDRHLNKMTGITSHIDIPRNIDTILNLHPNTRQFAVIGGADLSGQHFAAMAYEALAPYVDNYATIDLVGLSMAELLDRVVNLPENTSILYTPIHMDSNGERFIPREILIQLSQVANAPIYSFWDTSIGFGVVGGYVSDTQALGQQLASIGKKVLAGIPPNTIPIEQSSLAFHFDWQQMNRWNISSSQLPEGSIIHNQPTTPWQIYRLQILGILAVIGFLLAAVIILLLIKRHLRKQVTERTQKLFQINSELETVNLQLLSMVTFERERHQEKMRFLDMLAHELRTPISTIHILLHGHSAVPDGVGVALNDMKLVIERCVQIGQLENKAFKPKLQNFDLYQVIRKVLENFQQESERVNCELCGEVVMIQTDMYLLEIILHNLLDNALKYSAEASPIDIVIIPEMQNQQLGVLLRISNHVGFAGYPDPTKIFEKYYRSPKAHHRSGSGLGLSLIQGIASMLGMKLNYETPNLSIEDAKVVFVLWIPLTLNSLPENKDESG